MKMKYNKRHHTSSDDSDDSDASANSSSSGIDSGRSSLFEHHFNTKKRKRADTSDSESDSDEQKRSQKRNQKKKTHGNKKRRSDSVAESVSGPVSTTSEGDISSKTKRKHKRQRSSSIDEEQIQRRLQSVVVKRRGSCEEANQPIRNYYKQKEYQRSVTPEEYEGLRSLNDEYQQRPREQEDRYHQREDTRGFNRYNKFEGRGGLKRREFEDRRGYREARGPPDNYRLREREFPDRKERYHEEGLASERPRKVHREKLHHRERPRSRCQEERHRRPEGPAGREEQYRVGRSDERMERCGRPDERNVKQERPLVKTKPRSRDRKSGYANSDENKKYDWGKGDVETEAGKDPAEKEKPNFGLSGKLTADANTVNGVVIKYTEPDDAKLPKRRWRLYPFKGDKALPTLYIHRQSAFLIGRNNKVVDIVLKNPSISRQHAALQFRAIPFTRPDGTQGRRVRPYVIDLESANGTFVNRKKLEPCRYVELLKQDVITFGFSRREYVLLHEDSNDDAQDDERQEPPVIGSKVTTTNRLRHEKRVK